VANEETECVEDRVFLLIITVSEINLTLFFYKILFYLKKYNFFKLSLQIFLRHIILFVEMSDIVLQRRGEVMKHD